MIFEWNEARRAANLARHRVDFEAARSFDWRTSVQSADATSTEGGEPRWWAFGKIGGRLHLLVFITSGERTVVVSLRKANLTEQKAYETETRPHHAGGGRCH
jgi:uncharacterized DUF497 family protein